MLIDQAKFIYDFTTPDVEVSTEGAFLNEAAATTERFKTEVLDVEKFIKNNMLKEVSNPVFFNGPTPTEDGLLSNEIFGITKTERAGIYAYISLGSYFIQPLIYKTLLKLNGKIADIINGTDYFIIDDKGELVQSDDGDTGIDWFKKNFSKIKFKKNDSTSRNKRIDFIEKVKNKMWVDKWVVIPAYYRDVETRDAGIGVGEINKLYSSLIMATRALKETSEYGLTLSDVTKARVQNILVQIFDWFGNGTTINGKETPANLPGKMGLIKRGTMYKTIDYSARLVMSAPDVSGEDIDDLMIDMDHAALPLAAALCCFKPFISFWLRRFFENRFAGKLEYPIKINEKETIMVPLVDYQIYFSDIEIDKQIERFIHGYSNRFIPIELPVDKEEFARRAKNKEYKNTVTGKPLNLSNLNFYMYLSGYKLNNSEEYKETKQEYSEELKVNRRITWCDLFYMAACDVTEDKMVLITRFPIDSYLNQYPTKVRIKSTVKTTPMVIQSDFEDNMKLYKWYPYIENTDINSNTSPVFEDTLSISNGLIEVMGMDYDGDTAIVKPVYTIEANKECEEQANAKIQVLGMNGFTTRGVSKECILCLYELTVHPDKSVNFVNPEF
jgi:hypothetical protein